MGRTSKLLHHPPGNTESDQQPPLKNHTMADQESCNLGKLRSQIASSLTQSRISLSDFSEDLKNLF